METAPGPVLAVTPARSRGKWIVRGLIVLAAVALLAVLGKQGTSLIPRFASWVNALGFWGPVAFIGGYALASVALVSGAALTLAAGAIFGLLKGTLLAFVGAVGGSCAAFLVSRHLARGAVQRRIAGNPKFAAIDRAVAGQGRRIVFLLRLSPLFPFVFLNYALGLTGVRFRDYLLASFGMLPGSLLFVYSGKVIGDVSAAAGGAMGEKGAGHWVLLGCGLAATLLASALVARIAKRALAEAEAA